MPLKQRKTAKPINWGEIRQKMNLAEAAMDEAVRPTPEKARQIMLERARKLALAFLEPEKALGRVELLVFLLGHERYALETDVILEVVPLSHFTPVPGVPSFLVGVTPYHGEVLALIDPRKLFGMETAGVTDLSRIVVVGERTAQCGILVDKALEVILLQPEEIIDQAQFANSAEGTFFRGVTQGALIVLDGKSLLRDARLIVRQDEITDSVLYQT